MTNSTDGTQITLADLVQLQADARQLRVPRQQLARRRQLGQQRSRIRGRGMEFAEVRQYQPGDDIRTIDWRVTARRQEPHTKLYQEERERPVLILCDFAPSLFFASGGAYKSVRATETAALLAWRALLAGNRVGGILVSSQAISVLRPARRRGAVLSLLQRLTEFHEALHHQWHNSGQVPDNSRFNDALSEARRVARTGSRITVISDFLNLDQTGVTLLGQLALHNDVDAVRICDPLERELPPHGEFAVRQGEDVIWFDAGSAALRQAWNQRIREHERFLAESTQKTGCRLLTLSTMNPPVEQLRRNLIGPNI
jgi:uncharacterized protein (DUF58 family)